MRPKTELCFDVVINDGMIVTGMNLKDFDDKQQAYEVRVTSAGGHVDISAYTQKEIHKLSDWAFENMPHIDVVLAKHGDRAASGYFNVVGLRKNGIDAMKEAIDADV
jgi:hypothetical protein